MSKNYLAHSFLLTFFPIEYHAALPQDHPQGVGGNSIIASSRTLWEIHIANEYATENREPSPVPSVPSSLLETFFVFNSGDP